MKIPTFRTLLLLLFSVCVTCQSKAQDFELIYDLNGFDNIKDSLLKKDFHIKKQRILDNEDFLLKNFAYSILTANYLLYIGDQQNAIKFIRAIQEKGFDNDKRFEQYIFAKSINGSQYSFKPSFDSSLINMIDIMYSTEQNIRTYYRRVVNNHKITDPLMMKIDSLNFMLLDSFFYKHGTLPADNSIGYEAFDKLYLVMFHTIRRLPEEKWIEVKKVLDNNLKNGVLSNSYYANIVDQYYKSKNLPLLYGTYLHDYKDQLTEINKNRKRIGLRSYEETYFKSSYFVNIQELFY